MMPIPLRLELIGDNWQAYRRAEEAGTVHPPLHDMINIIKYGSKHLQPWVAKITGIDDRYGFKREFLRGTVDFSESDDVGEWGIYKLFILYPGIYEINECIDLGKSRRYFMCVYHGKSTEISREEVRECLNATLE